MASAVDSRLAYARLSAVATASRLPTANRGSNNSYTTSWDTTFPAERLPGRLACGKFCRPFPCRRSSVVERALGKGEAECSIHSGGTINSRT